MYKMLRRIGNHRQQFWEIEYVLEGAEQFGVEPIIANFSINRQVNAEVIQIDFEGLRATFLNERRVYLRPSDENQLLHFLRFCDFFNGEFTGDSPYINIQIENNRHFIDSVVVMQINSLNGEINFNFIQRDLRILGHLFMIPLTREFIPVEYIE